MTRNLPTGGIDVRQGEVGPSPQRRASVVAGRLVVALVVALWAIGVATAPAQAEVKLTDLGTLGGRQSGATAVSGTVVVGFSYEAGNGTVNAFAYDLSSDTEMRDLGSLGGGFSFASAVSGMSWSASRTASGPSTMRSPTTSAATTRCATWARWAGTRAAPPR